MNVKKNYRNLLFACTVAFTYKTSIWKYNFTPFIRISDFILDVIELYTVLIPLTSTTYVLIYELAVDIKLHARLCICSSRLYMTVKLT
jgi:hypothetical protein